MGREKAVTTYMLATAIVPPLENDAHGEHEAKLSNTRKRLNERAGEGSLKQYSEKEATGRADRVWFLPKPSI